MLFFTLTFAYHQTVMGTPLTLSTHEANDFGAVMYCNDVPRSGMSALCQHVFLSSVWEYFIFQLLCYRINSILLVDKKDWKIFVHKFIFHLHQNGSYLCKSMKNKDKIHKPLNFQNEIFSLSYFHGK